MTEVLYVYKQAKLIKEMDGDMPPVAILSYEEKLAYKLFKMLLLICHQFRGIIHVLHEIMSTNAIGQSDCLQVSVFFMAKVKKWWQTGIEAVSL